MLHYHGLSEKHTVLIYVMAHKESIEAGRTVGNTIYNCSQVQWYVYSGTHLLRTLLRVWIMEASVFQRLPVYFQ